jgi:TatD DNase family protein
VISFKNAPRVREVAAALPLDRILIETDCPYLAPVPHRGKLNHSGLMKHTHAALADARGEDEEPRKGFFAKLFGL